jgi:hypothetical protein
VRSTALLPLSPAGKCRSGGCAPPQDLLNHPTTPNVLSACKLAKPRTVQASPLRLQSNGRTLRQVVSRFIRSSAATILPSDFEEETERAWKDLLRQTRCRGSTRSHTSRSDPFGLRRADQEDVVAACAGDGLPRRLCRCFAPRRAAFHALHECSFEQCLPSPPATAPTELCDPSQVSARPPSPLGTGRMTLACHLLAML